MYAEADQKATQVMAVNRTSDVAENDVYFSADVETDGPIPGPYSLLSFSLVFAGRFDGVEFERPKEYNRIFYRELRPISDKYEQEALNINNLDRHRLLIEGCSPVSAMSEAYDWIVDQSAGYTPVLVAYPLSFDWTWLYWYFVSFSKNGSPFKYSHCFDLKTAVAIKTKQPIARAGRSKLSPELKSRYFQHSHNAKDDAISQAEIFANLFVLGASNGRRD